MLLAFFKKYGRFMLVGVFFFYLGCIVTLNFLRLDCSDAINNIKKLGDIATLNKGKGVFDAIDTEYGVLILTSPDNENRRNGIRSTWGKLINNIVIQNGAKHFLWNQSGSKPAVPPSFIKLYFAIGIKNLNYTSLAKLWTENKMTKDLLLLENVEDGYKNLTQKILQGFKWLSENSRELKYVIKVDDDSFARIDLIVRDLEAFAPEMNGADIRQYVSYKDNISVYKGLYWGYFMGRANVYLKGKWQEKKWFLCDHYLPYALGGGYVISRTIVDYFSRNADFLSQYHSEDVSVGVWTAALDGIHRVHDLRFDTEWISRGCQNSMLVRHKQTPSDMVQMYNSLLNSEGKRLCEIESTIRKSYLYDWTVLPSKCCNA